MSILEVFAGYLLEEKLYKFLFLEKFCIILLLLFLFEGNMGGLKLMQDNEITKIQTRESLVNPSF